MAGIDVPNMLAGCQDLGYFYGVQSTPQLQSPSPMHSPFGLPINPVKESSLFADSWDSPSPSIDWNSPANTPATPSIISLLIFF